MLGLLRPSRLSRRPRRVVLGAVVLGGVTLGAGAACGQALEIRPTDTIGDGVTDGSAPDLAAPDADQGLRGTTSFGGTSAAAPEQAVSPEEPVAPQRPETAPVTPPRPGAGQGSALMTPRVGPPKLPALAPYPTSQRLRGATIDTLDGSQNSAAAGPTGAAAAVVGPTVAALPTPLTVHHRTLDDAPFAPIGYTVGTLRLTPYVEESVGYDSNPDQTATGVRPSAFERTEGGFSLLSLWSSNELKAVMHGGYDVFFNDPGANRPDAAGTVDYRYTVTRDIALDAEGRFAVTTQRPGSPEVNAAVLGRPLVSSYGTTIGGSDTLGRLTLGLHGLFDRTQYENGQLGDGTVVALDTETFNDYGLALRADYEITPTFKPFTEVTLDSRVHDTRLDLAGYARDSDGVLGRLGTSFQLTPLVTGTVSAGYEDRSYADRRLRDLRGPVVDATLIYAVTPLTTLTLLANTSFNETNLAGSPGAESRSVSLSVSHALLRNLTLTGIFGYLNTDYIGSTIVENTYSATLKASYALSRSLVLEASYNHETLSSTDKTSSFDQDVVLFGLRMQH